MGKIVLYTGRFQPFHNGHKRVIDLLVETFDLIKVALGEKRGEDFLDYTEREEIILNTFPNSRIEIYGVENLPKDHPDYFNWGNCVLKRVGKVDFVVTGKDSDNYVQDDFFRLDYPIILVPRFNGISGTEIRRKISANEQDWKNYVPQETQKIIDRKLKNGNK